jgi:simple sugar transport system substrate-binding protein
MLAVEASERGLLGAGPGHGRRIHVLKKAITLLSAAVIAVGAGFVSTADAAGKTYYWVSHGSPADPVWTYFLAGAKQWAEDTGNTVNTSFQNGDVPAHQEAIRAAISAGAAGIATTSPDPGSLVEVVKEANAKGIPIINFNTPDPQANFDAYVGGDNKTFGKNWAQYLVDKKLVKSGDFVWMPVEVPGATYGVQEEEGIASVFKPLNITWEVTDATLDQAEIITRMSDYLTANRSKIKAIIGLGDLVNGSIKRVFDQVGVKAGEIPVIGWGNSTDTTQEVLNGYVNAAQWQDPQATSYMALSMAAMAASKIPPGFNIITGALYEKDTAEFYDKILSAK